jgi:starvation-inducible outer membrane lipoprotein
MEKGIMMKKYLLVLICLTLVGCATPPKTENLEKQVTELQETITKKNEEIKVKEGQLKEKDLKIEQLRKKLESFGVFQ